MKEKSNLEVNLDLNRFNENENFIPTKQTIKQKKKKKKKRN